MENNFIDFLYYIYQNNKVVETGTELITMDKPTVFIFGGTGTYGEYWVKTYLKWAKGLLGVFGDDVNLITVDYDSADYKAYDTGNFEDIDYNCSGFVDHILMPLVQNKNGKIDCNLACKNIRNITIVSHCFGDNVAQRILKDFKQKLIQLGFNEEEGALICEQIFEISYGVDAIKSDAKQLNIVSPFDTYVDDNNFPRKLLLKDLESIEMSPFDKKELVKFVGKSFEDVEGVLKPLSKFFLENNRVYIVPNGKTIHLATSYPFDKTWVDHSMGFASRDENYKVDKNATIVGDYVSRCILCALCNSVANSIMNSKSEEFIPFDLNELISQLQNIVRMLNSSMRDSEKEQT